MKQLWHFFSKEAQMGAFYMCAEGSNEVSFL